ncbi:EAL domain-containing protein [Sulfurimonas sp.]|uniref:EAL domain-containing protein n=1 Tax=Sulfurimonas sp. TaxID=2022749 RepID=UPI002606A5D2|nr:phosphodiesterase [Sulfurimonas sp.]
MLTNKKASLRAKIVLITLFLVTLLGVIFFISTMTATKINKRIILEHDFSMRTIDGYLKHFTEINMNITKALFIKNQDILDSLKNKKERNIVLNKQFLTYKAFVPSLKKIEFIQKSSFSKMHYFEKNALETRQIQSGFELEKGICHYEIVRPVYVKNSFLGVVEFSYDAKRIMTNLYAYYHKNIALIFFKNQKINLLYASSPIIKNFIEQYDKGESFPNIVMIEGKEYSLYSRVENSKNKIMLLSFYNATPNLNDRKNLLYMLLFVGTVLALMAIFIINFVVNYFIGIIYKRENEIQTKVDTLSFQSRHNSITALPNLKVFQDKVQSLNRYVIFILKIDNIDILKTTYGGELVKSVLKVTSQYLIENLPRNASLYHMDFDEFTIVLNEPTPKQDILLSSQIKSYFEVTPAIVDDVHIHLSFSVGISGEENDEENNNDLFSQANIALLEAKHRGRSFIVIYSPNMSKVGSYTQLSKNIAILQKDLENEALTPFYQAIVDVKTEKTFKYEALARIKDGDKIISPYLFMEAAEVAGLHSSITKQMIQKTFLYFESSSVQFSINITKQDLLENYLSDFLQAKAKRHNIKPSNVTLEILEDVAIDDEDAIIQQINQLSDLGFVIAIDDFGVESSNMSKLTELCASFIKIDGSFIKDIDTNKKHFHIVESLVFIARKLDMKIIAEFVHNEEVFNVVKELGIDYAQGYYFAEPLIEVDF